MSSYPALWRISLPGPLRFVLIGWAAVSLICSGTAAPSFASAVRAGIISTFNITEASGLIDSRQNPGVLWTHNDSGFAGSVFAISTNGDLLARYTIPGVFSGDFEDISFGPGPNPDFQYIYLGDIGDNFLFRTSIRVLRFPEPSVYHYQVDNPRYDFAIGAQEITLTYPDGPFNAEALMVDPLTGDLFIATKLTNSSRIYRATRGQLDGGGPVELTFIREISFFKPSAGDISSDGRLVLLRRGGNGAAWVRQPTQSVGDALGGSSSSIQLAAEPNGESIAIHATGQGYYTLSEGLFQTNYFYRRTDSGKPREPVVLIKPGDPWRYDDSGTDRGVAWRQLDFVDTNWNSGPGQLGYGQGDEQTLLSFGEDDFAKHITTYFRKSFNKAASPAVTNVALRVCFNDGVAVYLNGTQVFRRNLPNDAVYDALALSSGAERENYWISAPINPALLRTGTNVVAAEIHRFDPMGPDLSFDLQLLEGAVELPPRFTASPRLVSGQWRIDLAGPSGSSVVIENSDDIQTWAEAGRVILTGGVGVFQEPAIPQPLARFYRLRY